MRKFQLTILILCLMATLTASKSQAQEYRNWSGWFLGASADVFWDQPAENMFSKPRLQFSKVLQVGDDPNIISMPGLSWRTAVGEIGIDLNAYHKFLTHNSWEFLAGVGASPIIVETANGGNIAKKGTVMIDVVARYGLSQKFGFVGGFKVDWQAPYSQDTENIKNLGTIMTFTLGVNADFLTF